MGRSASSGGLIRSTLPPLRVAVLNSDGSRSRVCELPDPRELLIAALAARGVLAVPIDDDESQIERRLRRRDFRILRRVLRRLEGGAK